MKRRVEISERAIHDIIDTAEHAGRSAAELNVIFTHGMTVEHGIESDRLKHVHRRNFANFCDFIHCRNRNVATVLLLCQMQEGNGGANTLTAGKFGQNFSVNFFVAFGSEIPRNARVVLIRVGVSHLPMNITLLGEGGRGGRKGTTQASQSHCPMPGGTECTTTAHDLIIIMI